MYLDSRVFAPPRSLRWPWSPYVQRLEGVTIPSLAAFKDVDSGPISDFEELLHRELCSDSRTSNALFTFRGGSTARCIPWLTGRQLQDERAVARTVTVMLLLDRVSRSTQSLAMIAIFIFVTTLSAQETKKHDQRGATVQIKVVVIPVLSSKTRRKDPSVGAVLFDLVGTDKIFETEEEIPCNQKAVKPPNKLTGKRCVLRTITYVAE
jgi:hypothetical protein